MAHAELVTLAAVTKQVLIGRCACRPKMALAELGPRELWPVLSVARPCKGR